MCRHRLVRGDEGLLSQISGVLPVADHRVSQADRAREVGVHKGSIGGRPTEPAFGKYLCFQRYVDGHGAVLLSCSLGVFPLHVPHQPYLFAFRVDSSLIGQCVGQPLDRVTWATTERLLDLMATRNP